MHGENPDHHSPRGIESCPGYILSDLRHDLHGVDLSARLELAGAPADVYGQDIADLVLEVEHQSEHRLHVHIYDVAKKQYQIPERIWRRPQNTSPSRGDLQFHHVRSPFAFWVTRSSTGETIFDTRPANIPIHTDPIIRDGKPIRDTTTPAYPLVFSDQYLQLATAVHKDANIYGLGEVDSTSGVRLDPSGSVLTMWNRDAGTPKDSNLYGAHPFYIETRWPSSGSGPSQSHGVFLLNSHGMDVLLRSGVIEYRILGGTLDLYFLSGPTQKAVVEQYADVVGHPVKMPFWAFGFHLCRWEGQWKSLKTLRGVVERMRNEGIPLEVIWNDLDYMDRYRNFVVNKDYNAEDFREFTKWLHAQHLHYIPIVDAAIPRTERAKSDPYTPYEQGRELDVFVKDHEGKEFVGTVWPGPTVFPDWTAPHVQKWWQDCFDSFRDIAHYDGIWLDMNEPASFSTKDDVEKRRWNGDGAEESAGLVGSLLKRILGLGAKEKDERDEGERNVWGYPPYDIHNGQETLGSRTVAASARLADGTRHYNSHNLYAYEENLATREVLLKQEPGVRPFILSRSNFAGQGRVSAHWLGDNYSTWDSMRASVQGVLQFQMFQMPMVGPDACGFSGDATEELSNRWMQLSAFYPFFRNHNAKDARDQEPYVWESVKEASKKAIRTRYQLLAYWESLFAVAARSGTPPLRPLAFEFDDPLYAAVHAQFMIGSALLITPVMEEGAASVKGFLPPEGAPWRDWWTHEVVDADERPVELDAPLGHINVHIRAGSILPIYTEPGYTLSETRQGALGLIVSLDDQGAAEGTFVLDDGISLESAETVVTVSVRDREMRIECAGDCVPPKGVGQVIVMGARTRPAEGAVIGGKGTGEEDLVPLSGVQWEESTQTLVLEGVAIELGPASSYVVKW